MKKREPFRIGRVIGDYLKFLVFRPHQVAALLAVQLVISGILLAVIAMFDIDSQERLQFFALAAIALVSLAARPACGVLVLSWREKGGCLGRILLFSTGRRSPFERCSRSTRYYGPASSSPPPILCWVAPLASLIQSLRPISASSSHDVLSAALSR